MEPGTAPIDATNCRAIGFKRMERIEELSEDIGLLSAHLNAANCRMLELIAEFDELSGWSDQGAKTCAHWLNWKCGYGLNAARERVRVARALKNLPKIKASFSLGQISYSKVRAMTRVGTPENESYLLGVGIHGTASHVEKLVRGYRWRIKRDEENRADKELQDRRSFRYYWDEDGMLVIRGRLTAEQGAAFIKALDACRETVGQDVSAVTSDHPPKVDEKANPDIAKENMDYYTPNDKLYRSQVDALVLIAESYLAHGLQSAPGGDKYQLLLTVDQALLDDPQQSGNCSLANGQSLPLETMKRIGCDASIRTVIRDPSGEPINIGRKSRTIPNPMRLALLKRDAGCRFPSCDQQRYIHGHHIRHWAEGGETSLNNLVMLCHHHHRLVHEKGFGVARSGPNRFTFKSPSGNVVHDTAPAVAAVNDLDGSIRYWDKQMDISYDSQTAATKWRGERIEYSWVVGDLALRDGRQAADVRMT